MIVEVKVPSLSLHVDVRCEETGTVGEFKEAVCLLIQKMIGEEEVPDRKYDLYLSDRSKRLSDDTKLAVLGISGGSKFLLI